MAPCCCDDYSTQSRRKQGHEDLGAPKIQDSNMTAHLQVEAFMISRVSRQEYIINSSMHFFDREPIDTEFQAMLSCSRLAKESRTLTRHRQTGGVNRYPVMKIFIRTDLRPAQSIRIASALSKVDSFEHSVRLVGSAAARLD